MKNNKHNTIKLAYALIFLYHQNYGILKKIMHDHLLKHIDNVNIDN